jgi:hypothetical protein
VRHFDVDAGARGIYPMRGNGKMGAWREVGAAAQQCCRALTRCVVDVMGRDGGGCLKLF